jgi:hypothetical protein
VESRITFTATHGAASMTNTFVLAAIPKARLRQRPSSPPDCGCGHRRDRRKAHDRSEVPRVGLQAAQGDARARHPRERELAKLAARRQKWIDQYDADRITKQEFEQKIDAVTNAMHEIEASMPAAPSPGLDHRAVVEGLVETLAAFRTLPFADQRSTLKRVVQALPVIDDGFTEVAVSGAFLGELPTLKPHNPQDGGVRADTDRENQYDN